MPRANITESTAPRICTPTPTPATAVPPSRPTMSMSHSPTNDSIENEKMTGQASAHVVRSRSESHARVASIPMGMERMPAARRPTARSTPRAYHGGRATANARASTSVGG